MCIRIANTGVSAIFLGRIIVLRGNFRGLMGGIFQLTKRQNAPAVTAINTAATTVATTTTYYYLYYYDISIIKVKRVKLKI